MDGALGNSVDLGSSVDLGNSVDLGIYNSDQYFIY